LKNQRNFFDYIAAQLGITSYEDWYHYTLANVTRYSKDNYMDEIYQKSLPKALMVVYPHYSWLPWKFLKKPENFWKDIKMQRRYLDHLRYQVFHLDRVEDMLYVSKEEYIKEGNGQRPRAYIYVSRR
jgi:hypothetical protein